MTGLVLSKRSVHDELKDLLSASFALTMIRNMRRMFFPPLLSAVLLVGLCQQGLAQYEALELGPEEPASSRFAHRRSDAFSERPHFRWQERRAVGAIECAREGQHHRANIGERGCCGGGADVRVINANGRVLMPGLIDAHWHMFMAATSPAVITTADPGYLNLLAARQAEATLMRGFTTIRDMGGPVFGLKRAIDEGITVGPRIYPSGAMISQTSGHGDFRARYEVPRTLGGPLSQSETRGHLGHC